MRMGDRQIHSQDVAIAIASGSHRLATPRRLCDPATKDPAGSRAAGPHASRFRGSEVHPRLSRGLGSPAKYARFYTQPAQS
jgi:hypothetical protein